MQLLVPCTFDHAHHIEREMCTSIGLRNFAWRGCGSASLFIGVPNSIALHGIPSLDSFRNKQAYRLSLRKLLKNLIDTYGLYDDVTCTVRHWNTIYLNYQWHARLYGESTVSPFLVNANLSVACLRTLECYTRRRIRLSSYQIYVDSSRWCELIFQNGTTRAQRCEFVHLWPDEGSCSFVVTSFDWYGNTNKFLCMYCALWILVPGVQINVSVHLDLH